MEFEHHLAVKAGISSLNFGNMLDLREIEINTKQQQFTKSNPGKGPDDFEKIKLQLQVAQLQKQLQQQQQQQPLPPQPQTPQPSKKDTKAPPPANTRRKKEQKVSFEDDDLVVVVSPPSRQTRSTTASKKATQTKKKEVTAKKRSTKKEKVKPATKETSKRKLLEGTMKPVPRKEKKGSRRKVKQIPDEEEEEEEDAALAAANVELETAQQAKRERDIAKNLRKIDSALITPNWETAIARVSGGKILVNSCWPNALMESDEEEGHGAGQEHPRDVGCEQCPNGNLCKYNQFFVTKITITFQIGIYVVCSECMHHDANNVYELCVACAGNSATIPRILNHQKQCPYQGKIVSYIY